MEEFIESWGYLGIFISIIATGLGFPMPEELPVVIAGGLAGSAKVIWWIMLPVCIAAVILGDLCLYCIGRFWGRRLLKVKYIRTRVLTPERLEKIAKNFRKYGVKILLFARLTPGIRAPIFLTAGITKLPITKFLFADGIYAVPGVSLLFFLGFWFADSMITLIHEAERFKPIIIIVVVVAVAGYFAYRFLWKPYVTGSPKEMPPVVGPVAETIETVAEKMVEKTAEKIFPCPPGTPPGTPGCEPCAETKPAEPTPMETASNGTPTPTATPAASETPSQPTH